LPKINTPASAGGNKRPQSKTSASAASNQSGSARGEDSRKLPNVIQKVTKSDIIDFSKKQPTRLDPFRIEQKCELFNYNSATTVTTERDEVKAALTPSTSREG